MTTPIDIYFYVLAGIAAVLAIALLVLIIAYVRLQERHRELRHDYSRLHRTRVSAVEIGEGQARRRIEYARGDHDEPAA